MTNHPNRSRRMDHFGLTADAATGEWDKASIRYLGTVDRHEFYALQDTDDVHYDQHDGETFDREAMADAGIESKANIALTITWAK